MPETFRRLMIFGLLVAMGTSPASGAVIMKTLPGHVPSVVARLSAAGRLADTNPMPLAIGVPLRDPAGLDRLLAEIYDPASPRYHQYLTPEELTARFGPTEEDYHAVKEYARTNGLTVTTAYGNRLVLGVAGPAAAVEKAFHVTLRTYQHPTEGRQFFAPDTEPTLDARLRVVDVNGLNNFKRPRPKIRRHDVQPGVVVKGGTAPGGSAYLGPDLRNAYVPGSSLNGAGQMVGLVQFDGFSSNNIVAYENLLPGQPRVPLKTVLLDLFDGSIGSGQDEVCLDIELAIAMAPALSKIVVFEGQLPNTILNAMASSNTIKNLSCSWGWSDGPSDTTDTIFKIMAAQGQSFFNASGDSDAFVAGSNNDVDDPAQVNAPSSSPFITQVGGTVLAMNGSGISFASETVWNDRQVNPGGGNWGSSGGISTYYSITNCPWQTNVSMTAAHGSTTKRNIPDVALTAANVYSISGNQNGGSASGTSCAAPLWAGFMALVNQQAAALGRPAAGFINPAIFAIAASPNYPACFHDVTTGDNSWSGSPANFFAVAGYDLCTGLGTPNGTNLINALTGNQDALGILPATGYAFSGPLGGPFVPGTGSYQLTNSTAVAFNWSLISTSAWLQASITSGTLAGGASTNLSVSLTAAAGNLPLGNYSALIGFSNWVTHFFQPFPISLQIGQPLSLSPLAGFTGVGPVGGPFSPNAQNLVLTNPSSGAMTWSLINTSAWLSVSPAGSALAAGGFTGVTASLSATAAALPAGTYHTSLIFTNPPGVIAVVPLTLSVGQPVIVNGGFESGNFAGWTFSGNTTGTAVTSGDVKYVHSGTYGVQAIPQFLPAYLAQNLTTVPGQSYVLSLWLRNASGGMPNQVRVQWAGATVYFKTNFTSASWTNLNFLVTASSASTPLQLTLQDNPNYLGLDDISVTPLAPVAFKAVVNTVNSFQLAWNTSAGVVYQVQYKTNLLQANWLNLGGATVATTNTLTMTDTNALQLSRQRFYRLLLLP